MVVASHEGLLYLFDCAFDDNKDDYSSFYEVYHLSEDHNVSIDDVRDWEDLRRDGQHVGKVLVSQVRFDETIRKMIYADVFGFIKPGT